MHRSEPPPRREPEVAALDAVTGLPVMREPYRPPPPAGPRARMRPLAWGDPWRWLACGARDLAATPGIALFYGLCFWGLALALGLVFRHQPEYTLSIASGCLLVGPLLAMGLYEVSRRRAQGLAPRLGASLTCWKAHGRSLSLLLLVLLALELLWGRASLVVFAVFFDTGLPSTTGVLQALLDPANLAFVLVYLGVGSVFAALVFVTSVVSIPMILDRDTDAVSAAITSARVVFTHPGVLLLWGALITALVVLALLPFGLGLVAVGPWLGHASWHAYRGTVEWLPETMPEVPPAAG